MIKAIFFDFDGILTTDFNGTSTIADNLSKVTGLDVEIVKATYRTYFGHLLHGNGTHATVLENFCAALGKIIDLKTLHHALRKFPKNDEMFVLAKLLRQNYAVGIITDNTQERMEMITLDEGLPAIFNPIVVSGAMGAAKSDGTTRIFNEALALAGCDPEESIFIDNQYRNLTVPAKMGMQTYWHDDKKNDMKLLRCALAAWGIDLSMS